jgi:sugar-specific transcriptional regulator TrmB
MEEQLEKIGLSRQEATMYLNTLKLGIAKASEIARKANMKREAAYYTLKLLREKGFISEVIKSGVKHYSAASPKKILETIEEEKQEKENRIREIMPELEKLQKTALKTPKVEFYEGIEGFKTVANDTIKESIKEYYAILAEKTLHFLPHFHLQYRRRRKEKNIRVKVLTEKTDVTKKMKRKDKEELRETRFSNKIKGFNTSLFIYGNKIAYIMATENEQIGVIIENRDIAQFQEKIFNDMWKQAKH